MPSSPLTASSASRASSNSTKANPGGFLATHTFLSGPYLQKALSTSDLIVFSCRLPTYTLLSRLQSRCLDMAVLIQKKSACYVNISEHMRRHFRPTLTLQSLLLSIGVFVNRCLRVCRCRRDRCLCRHFRQTMLD